MRRPFLSFGSDARDAINAAGQRIPRHCIPEDTDAYRFFKIMGKRKSIYRVERILGCDGKGKRRVSGRDMKILEILFYMRAR